jgi:hypothetical protein
VYYKNDDISYSRENLKKVLEIFDNKISFKYGKYIFGYIYLSSVCFIRKLMRKIKNNI